MAENNEKKPTAKDTIRSFAMKALAGCTNPDGMRIKAVADRAKQLGWEYDSPNYARRMGGCLRDNMVDKDNPTGVFFKVSSGYFLLADSPVLGAAKEKLAAAEADAVEAEAKEAEKPQVREVVADGPVEIDTQVIVDAGRAIIDDPDADVGALQMDVNEKDMVVFVDDSGAEFVTEFPAAGIDSSLREFVNDQLAAHINGK